MKPKLSEKELPEWYKALGSDVSCTVLSLAQTVDGKDDENRLMLRFKGSKGTLWFKHETIRPTFLTDKSFVSEKPITVDISLSSLKSFDGKALVQNILENETVNIQM